jgi:sugar fermentation stimulation protein A
VGPRLSYRFEKALLRGTVISRPNRFIMIVKSHDGALRCHCPTTGRLGDVEPAGLPCLYSVASNEQRKTAYTVEAISTSCGRSWIGINQTAANRYIEFFLKNGSLTRLAAGEVRREVKLGESRIDFLVGDTYIEVKTPLIMLPAGRAVATGRKSSRFDSFDRLIRHMGELRRSLSSGMNAKIILCYLYDAAPFRPPPLNGSNARILAAARSAEDAGVERWQVNLKVSKEGVALIRYFRSRPHTEGQT